MDPVPGKWEQMEFRGKRAWAAFLFLKQAEKKLQGRKIPALRRGFFWVLFVVLFFFRELLPLNLPEG